MKIRKAGIKDWQQLNFLYSELDQLHIDSLPGVFRKPEGFPRSKDYFEKIFTDPNSAIFVAEIDQGMIGFVHAFIRESLVIPLLVPRRFAVIEDLMVKNQFQGKGVGRKLMYRAENWILERDTSLVELNVWEFNEGARKFYESVGYKTASRKMWKKIKK